MKRLVITFSLLLSATLTPPARAEDETVVVTATRTLQPIYKTAESVSVITAGDLEQQHILSLPDMLQEIPGLSVVRNGGLGQNATVSIRGAEAGQTLVLIDGVRINDPSTVDNE